jgi:hypothetical protein
LIIIFWKPFPIAKGEDEISVGINVYRHGSRGIDCDNQPGGWQNPSHPGAVVNLALICCHFLSSCLFLMGKIVKSPKRVKCVNCFWGQKDALALIIISTITLVSCLQISNELWYYSP